MASDISKLKFPAMKKGAASQSSSDADPLGLGEMDDSEMEMGEGEGKGGDDPWADEESFDPERPIGEASLEELKAALVAKEREAEKDAAKAQSKEEPAADDPLGLEGIDVSEAEDGDAY